uniref:Ankyrin repeat-containing protein n=1 Tax=Noccaea caerulescens TaxID=107243 RepID=A0A1J3EK05_NOCCA
MTIMEEKQSSPIAEKQQSFNGIRNQTQQEKQTKSMEKQQSFRCAENTQPRKARALEKQVSFQGVNVENHQPSRLGRSMEKQQSFRSVTTVENQKRGVLEKLPSFGKAASMERQKSFRGGFLEKQKSFRVVMERQLSFIGERRKKNESPGKRGDSNLHIAARTGNLSKVKELIRGCCDGGGEELKELLSKQNLEGETSLYTAAENGHSVVVEEMLKHMDLETASIAARNGFDPFHVAAKQGHLEVLKKLLDTFPNLAMTTDLSCTTALHTAATQGHIDVVNLLLETDSNLAKIAKNNGKTALHSAARMGHVEVVKSLIGNDPSIGFRTDKKGQTALHMAVKGQNDGIVEELVKPDIAVLSVEDNKGNTPLHIATNKGRTKIVRCLVSFEGINLNPINKAGDTPLDIAEKIGNAELVSVLKEAGAATAKGLGKPQNPAKQLKQTVSDIKHEVQSQLQQSRQTGVRVRKIAKRLKKLHTNGLNNAINSATIVAVLIATVAFAAIFTIPGQYEEDPSKGVLLGQAHIANKAPFLVFFIFDSLALFISLAVVVVQTSVVVIEQKAKKKLVFVINKLMWCACLFISIAFVSLSYIVVGKEEKWLAVCATVIGGTIMLTTIGAMCYCVVMHRMEESKLRSIRKERSKSQSFSMSRMPSDSEILNGEYNKRMYAL